VSGTRAVPSRTQGAIAFACAARAGDGVTARCAQPNSVGRSHRRSTP
jgi:hypothetical protein